MRKKYTQPVASYIYIEEEDMIAFSKTDYDKRTGKYGYPEFYINGEWLTLYNGRYITEEEIKDILGIEEAKSSICWSDVEVADW